jgi:hypothetical protein
MRERWNPWKSIYLACVASVTAGLVLTGCVGPVSYTGNAPAPHGASVRDWRTIEVVHLGQMRRDYEIIGEVRGDALLDSVVSMKKMAARLNADAITLPVPDGYGYKTSQAIRYKQLQSGPRSFIQPMRMVVMTFCGRQSIKLA